MISIIVETLVSLFDSILRVYYITKFNNCTVRHNVLFFPTILLVFIVTLIGDKFFPGYSTVITIALLIISIIYAVLISKRRYLSAIISACSWTIAYIFLGSFLHQILSMTIADFNDLLQGSTGLPRYILLLLHKVFLLAIVKFILVTTKADKSVDLKNAILTLFVSLVTVLGMGTAMKVLISGEYDFLEIPMLIITTTFVVINISVYILIYQIQKLQKSKYELEFLKQKETYEAKRYNDTSAVWNDIRKTQHDFRQHLTILKCQIEDNDINGCKEYIHSLMPKIERTSRLIKSDNSIIDYMINTKLSPLKDAEIKISGSVTGLSDIKDTDLACLIGNILENAVECVKDLKNKKIELTFHNENSNRVIICRNSISESVLSTNKELKSTKKNKLRHGYGHLIIERIVDDYDGMVEYFEENNMFCVQVIIPEPDSFTEEAEKSLKRAKKRSKLIHK